MPTPRQPNIVDRLFDFATTKEPRGHERALLEAAQPPVWVRLVFITISVSLLIGLFLWAIDGFGWVRLPWEITRQPVWLVLFGLLAATQFIYREVHRQYGKRALLEDQSPE